jgi:shikimate kinase
VTTDSIYLVGLRGTGKSTVGARLAGTLGWDHIDTDDLVERELAPLRRVVVSTGGGIVLDPSNRRILAQRWTVWLTATPSTLHARLLADPSTARRRPALTTLAGADELTKLAAERELLYREVAKLVLDTGSLSPEQAVSAILAACGNS